MQRRFVGRVVAGAVTSLVSAAVLGSTLFGGVASADGYNRHRGGDGGRGGDTYITCNFYGPTSVGNRGEDNRANLCSAVGSSQGGDGGGVR
jgi:hypothetical protein